MGGSGRNVLESAGEKDTLVIGSTADLDTSNKSLIMYEILYWEMIGSTADC